MGLLPRSLFQGHRREAQPTCRKGSLTPDMLCSVEYPVVDTRVRRICTSWGTTWREAQPYLGSLPRLLSHQPHPSPTAPLFLAQGLSLHQPTFRKCLRAAGLRSQSSVISVMVPSRTPGVRAGEVNGGPGAQESLLCVCAHILPFSRELQFLSHFPPLATSQS